MNSKTGPDNTGIYLYLIIKSRLDNIDICLELITKKEAEQYKKRSDLIIEKAKTTAWIKPDMRWFFVYICKI